MHLHAVSNCLRSHGHDLWVLHKDEGIWNLVIDSLLLHLFHRLGHDVMLDYSGSKDSQLAHTIPQPMCIA